MKIRHPTLDDKICEELNKLAVWRSKHVDNHHSQYEFMQAIQSVYEIPDWIMPEYTEYLRDTTSILNRMKYKNERDN